MAPRTALSVLAAMILVASGRAALLKRPEQDCINPSIGRINEFNFYPSEYRSVISDPAPVAPGATIVDATDFDIKYYETYKVISAKRFGKSYVLYQCGTPDPTALPAGAAEGVAPGMASFEIPLYSVAVTDTTANGFLSELGLLDRVARASPYSVEDCFARLAGSDGGCELATPNSYFDASDAAAAAAFRDANASMYAGADAVFVGFAGDASKDVLFSATADPGPLNRAEWVKFMAAFFNKEVDANDLFAKIKANYNAVKARVAAGQTAGSKPKVAWVSTNSSGVSFRLDPYKVTLMQDAGGAPFTRAELEAAGAVLSVDALYGTRAAFLPRGAAGLRTLLAQADVIVDETFYASTPAPANVSASLGFATPAAAAAAVPAIADERVFRRARARGARWDGHQSQSGSNGWFEMAVARPDWVLMDLARAIAPSTLAGANGALATKGPADTDFNFLLQVGADGPLGAPRLSAPASCASLPSCVSRAPAAICPNVFRDCATGALRQADASERCASWSVCVPVSLGGDAPRSAAARPAAAGAAAAALLGGAAAALLALA
ncbi:MAG: hypothetical protein J3K34DRAFT_518046 [Monoraphidium minutum]|nr:MAG: hypothetical protein J3K34DRAFT_518046 [Monoraphidium minutum]